MRRVTASTRRRDARSVGQNTLGRHCQQAKPDSRPKLDKYLLADSVVLKQSTNAQAFISCIGKHCPQRKHGQRIGIPLSNGEQTIHHTDIVMWIDTDVVENSLTKDDASNYNSLDIYGFEHTEHSRNPIQKLSIRDWHHVFFQEVPDVATRGYGRIQMLKSLKWEYSTK